MNNTFFNPHVGFPCEVCDFEAKTKPGLQLHVKAKHMKGKEVQETTANIVKENNETDTDNM